MKISIFFDFVCPFCYVGLHSLSRAIEGLDVELDFHPYELRRFPTPKVDPMHDEKRLKRFDEVLKPMAQALGIEMNLPWISPHPYTTDAFQGFYFARQAGRELDYVRLTFDVFYRQQKDIGDPAVLRMVMDELGLDGAASRPIKGMAKRSKAITPPRNGGRSFWIRQRKPWRVWSARQRAAIRHHNRWNDFLP